MSSRAPLDGVPLLEATFGAIADLLPGFPLGGGGAPLADADAFRMEMTAGGFRDVEVHTVTHGTDAPSAAAFWESNSRGSAPLVLLPERVGNDAFASLATGVVARLEQECGAGPVEVQWPARIAVGTR